MGHFADRLLEAVERKQSHVVVGLDPDYDLLPPEIREAHAREAYDSMESMKAACFREFLESLLQCLREDVVAVKPQIAYFEALGAPGYELYEDVVSLSRDLGYVVIADVKRGDIGSTAEAYARAHLDLAGADAVTVNPYFGTDGLEPFFLRAREEGKGVFVLVKTSNPSSSELQDVALSSGEPLYRRVAALVSDWGREAVGARGYSSIGAVVGGTHPAQGAELRVAMPGVPLLVPGYGAQGAQAADLAGLFDSRGTGAVVNSARAILYAFRKQPGVAWQDAARREAQEMRVALWKAAGRG
ncbi:MAG: orotidine 5'-phosphate decarboxylase [Actinobacteria bacterium RBG_16_64_13]|nr:MAG: orotidine 5'-phosphate decarboxylase [Actinobacteria bacterium RBG_16_64_13]